MDLDPRNRKFAWRSTPVAAPTTLTGEQIDRFDQDGFVLVEDAIAPAVIDELRADLDRFEAEAEAFLRTQPDGRSRIESSPGTRTTATPSSSRSST